MSPFQHMKSHSPALACLPEGKSLLGISGGRDSIALLHLLLAAGHRDLILCHLHHGLRGAESDADAEFVRQLAQKHRLPCEITKSNVKAAAKRHGLSIETAARAARHSFFLRMARRHRTHTVLLAHHADDQAETILGNILRGSGLDGLSGMQLSTTLDNGLTLLRPLLHTRRADIDHHIATHSLPYRDDSSNTSPDHRRNRLRHEALPLLNNIAGRDVTPLLIRLAQHAAHDTAYIDEQVRGIRGAFIFEGSMTMLHLFRLMPLALTTRIFAHWLRNDCGLSGIGSAEIQAAIRMTQPGGPAKINLPGGKHLRRKAKRLWVE